MRVCWMQNNLLYLERSQDFIIIIIIINFQPSILQSIVSARILDHYKLVEDISAYMACSHSLR